VSLNFIHNFFKGLRGKPVACAACTGRYLKKPRLAMTSHFTPFLLDIFMLYFPARLFSLSLSFVLPIEGKGQGAPTASLIPVLFMFTSGRGPVPVLSRRLVG
jgi:hypothetical protein